MSPREIARSEPGRQWLTSYLLPICVTLLALALHLYGLESKSLWFDELGTLTGAGWGGSWFDAIRKPLTIPTTPKPPLSFVVARLFLLLGDRVFFLRLPVVVFATLTIPLVYSLGKSLFDRQVGLLGAFLLAIAPLHIRYAQEARMYAMWTFLSVLSLYLFWRGIRSTRWQWWLGFAVATVLALYTHLFALLNLGVMVLFALWLLVRPRTLSQFPFRGWHFAAALAAVVLAYAPMAPFLSQGLLGGEGLGGEAVANWDLDAAVSALGLFGGGNQAGAVIYACLLGLAAVVLGAKGREALTLTAMWIALPVIVILLMPFGHAVLIRYFLVALPVYLLLVAYGLWLVIEWITNRLIPLWPSKGLRPAMGMLVTATLLGILAGISIPSVSAYYAETKQDWRGAVRLVGTLAEPGDQIFVRHVYHQVGVLFYARQGHEGAPPTTEGDVQVLPYDLDAAFPEDDSRGRWLIVPYRDSFLPGGALEASIQPHYRVEPPIVLRPTRVPKEGRIIAPTSYRTLAVVPVVRSDLPSIYFWAEDDTLIRGACTWLYWRVNNVREVYLEGEGVAGQGERQECPTATTNYELEIIHLDGTRTSKTYEILVTEP